MSIESPGRRKFIQEGLVSTAALFIVGTGLGNLLRNAAGNRPEELNSPDSQINPPTPAPTPFEPIADSREAIPVTPTPSATPEVRPSPTSFCKDAISPNYCYANSTQEAAMSTFIVQTETAEEGIGKGGNQQVEPQAVFSLAEEVKEDITFTNVAGSDYLPVCGAVTGIAAGAIIFYIWGFYEPQENKNKEEK